MSGSNKGFLSICMTYNILSIGINSIDGMDWNEMRKCIRMTVVCEESISLSYLVIILILIYLDIMYLWKNK